MFDRFSRSWTLAKASASVLGSDKELLLFPLISFAALVVVTIAFALPMWGFGLLQGLHGHGPIPLSAYVFGFLFYFSQYFVIIFFNAALVGAAMVRLEGGNPTFRDGLRIAQSRVGVIAGYAAIAATVGMVLRAIQERVGFLGRIVVGMLGAAWSIATFLVVPVLVVRKDMGPVEAVKESAGLLRETWGENVIGQVGIGAAFALVYVGVLVGGGFLLFVSFLGHDVRLLAFALIATALAIAAVGLVHAALSGIYEAVLYRYATKGEAGLGFDEDTLHMAFRPK